MAAAGAPPRTMTVMTATERQLTKKIIEEKDERTKAVNDVWRKLDQMQAEVNNLKAAGTTAAVATAASADASRRGSNAAPAVTSVELQELKAEMDNQRNTFTGRLSTLDNSVEELRASLGRAEMEAQQAVGKCRESQDAMGTRLDDEIKQLKENGPPPGKASEEKNVGKAMEAAPLGNAMVPASEQKFTGNSVGNGDDVLEKLREQVKGLDEKQLQTAKELTAVRSVLIEVHVNLPLHAVRASRIALRSTELSREERKLALSSLEAKEQHIRADIERVRERNDQSPELALSDLRAMNGDDP